MSDKKTKKRIVVDPAGCGCTECLIGLYTPEDQLTEKQITKMLNGREVSNHTSGPIRFNIEFGDDYLHVKLGDRTYDIERSKIKGNPVIEIPA